MLKEHIEKDSVIRLISHNDADGISAAAVIANALKEEDVQFLSESAFADACRPGNPKDTSVEEIAALYRALI